MTFLKTMAVTVVAAGMLAGAAQAQDTRRATVVEKVTGPFMVGVLDEYGYATDLTTDSYGDPYITSTLKDTGRKFNVVFYGCDAGVCNSFQLSTPITGGSLDAYDANAWNAKQRFIKMYIDNEGTALMRMDSFAEGGVTVEYIGAMLRGYERLMSAFNRGDY